MTQSSAPAADLPPLSTTLGLEGVQKFMLQHQLLSGARVYQVLTHEKRHLFTLRENSQQEMMARSQGGAPAGIGSRVFIWSVVDPSGTVQGAVSIQETGNAAVSTVADASGKAILAVNVQRGMAGGLNAMAAFPDGRPMFTAKGNLMRHNFSIHDPTGAEVAKIHEAWASVHDTYSLVLTGSVDPVCPLVFAILIDREKADEHGTPQHHPNQPHVPGFNLKI